MCVFSACFCSELEIRVAGTWIYIGNALCYKFPDITDTQWLSNVGKMVVATCGSALRGQRVTFRKKGNYGNEPYINICEVQIWGKMSNACFYFCA